MRKLFTVLFLSFAVLTASCSGTSTVKDAGKQFIDCSKANIGKVIAENGATVFDTVLALVLGGQPDWQSSLEAVGQIAGLGELACAVAAVESLLVAHADGSPSTAMSPAAARAMAFLKSHPEWSFVSAK